VDQRIKREWIDALLSREYKQGKCCLRRSDDTYCCLGVLCDLFVKEREIEWIISGTGDYYYLHDTSAYLPTSVMDWAGLDESGGWFDSSDGDRSLASMNDSGKSFEEIAKKIEEKL
jgi:hypothetical protein